MLSNRSTTRRSRAILFLSPIIQLLCVHGAFHSSLALPFAKLSKLKTSLRRDLDFTPTRGFSFTHTFRKGYSNDDSLEEYLAGEKKISKGRKKIPGFEYQEFRANMRTIMDKDITSRDLPILKRNEIEGYIRTIIESYNSNELIEMKDQIPGTNWRLIFSTETAILESLPLGATVMIKIYKDRNMLDYSLQFSEEIFGLKSIAAKCNYSFNSNSVQPGLLSFTYEEITTTIFGFQDIGIGFFGLLKGRANYVNSAYFDDSYWFDCGPDPVDPTKTCYNVYAKVDP